MAAAPKERRGRKRNAALKDVQLVYRACTVDFARSLQFGAASELVGKTDFDLLPEPVARVYQALEQQVLDTCLPVVSAGRLSPTQAEELVVVRSPVFSDADQVTGLEVNVLNIGELRSDYADLLARDLDHRHIFNRFPFGVWIHREGATVYQNRRWDQLMSEHSAEIDRWLATRQSDGLASDGTLYFQRSAVHWHGEDLQAVFCFVYRSNAENYIEKRKGARRDPQLNDVSAEPEHLNCAQIETSLINAIRFPLIVCDNSWAPLYTNKPAQYLLELLAGGGEGSLQEHSAISSLEHWFSDREKVDIETMMRQRNLVQMPLVCTVELAGRIYWVSVSPASWSGRSALLLTMQHNAEQQQQMGQLHAKLDRYEDFVAAGGDFQWEMDEEQRMTHLSIDLDEVLGVATAGLIGKPLTTIIERHVDSEDMAEWSVLSVDMRNHVVFRDREFKWQNRSGDKRVVRLSGVPVVDNQGQFRGYRGVGSDFTEAYKTASDVAFHASHDSLTGLVNRREFEQLCDNAIVTARDSKVTHALCFLDLDNFKVVNDTCGHLAGDELLRQLSALFSGLVRKSDVLARLGGDEFAVLVYDVGVNEVLRLANQIRSEVESFQFPWEDNRFSVGASIGVAIIDDRWEDRAALFGAADAACYEAKNSGRNRVSVYREDKQQDVVSGDATWIDRINSAIDEKRVRLCMQKIVSLDGYNQPVTRVELLMRIVEQSQTITPGTFLPAADRYGLTINLDKAVIERAIDWLEGQPHVTDAMQMCSINLHSRSFADDDFTVFLINALRAARFDVSILCFEISETAAVANLSGATRFMQRVGEAGCKFALDDFGSGLSSFSYLKDLPISYVKIDGKYIRNILHEAVDYAMVKAISDVGQSLGKEIIAEYVESEEVLEKLRDIGLNLAQGYQIGRPELIDF